jgi:hypothetical protein
MDGMSGAEIVKAMLGLGVMAGCILVEGFAKKLLYLATAGFGLWYVILPGLAGVFR